MKMKDQSEAIFNYLKILLNKKNKQMNKLINILIKRSQNQIKNIIRLFLNVYRTEEVSPYVQDHFRVNTSYIGYVLCLDYHHV